MSIIILVLASIFGIVLIGVSIVFYLEWRETKRIAHFSWLKKAGLRESSHIIYVTTSQWRGYQGW